jgi:hypothetical protein
MAEEAYVWVFEYSGERLDCRVTLIGLAFYASDDEWICELPVEGIAAAAHLSVERTNRVLIALERSGSIKKLNRGYQVVRGSSTPVKVPPVKSDRKSMSASARYRAVGELSVRDGWFCTYCRCDLTMLNVTLDHCIAVANGGGDEIENLCLACGPCNSSKGARYAFPKRLATGGQL